MHARGVFLNLMPERIMFAKQLRSRHSLDRERRQPAIRPEYFLTASMAFASGQSRFNTDFDLRRSLSAENA